MPNFIGSLTVTDETIDVYFATNPVRFSDHNIEAIINTRHRSWYLYNWKAAQKARNWLGDNVGKRTDGSRAIYSWLPGSTTYDALPRAAFEKFVLEFGEPNVDRRPKDEKDT